MADPRVYLMETYEDQTDEVKALIKLIGDSEDPSDETDEAEARLEELGKEWEEVAHLVDRYHHSIGYYER
jgi:hypothetical protein